MNTLRKIWNWIIVSSEDPTKTSLAVKGFLTTAGSILLLISPIVHWQITQSSLDQGIDIAMQITLALLALGSAITGLFGLFRKFYYLFKPKQ